MEYWDLFNLEGSLIESNHVRGEAILDGLYHHVVSILVQHQDGSILIMQRDFEKELFPGKYEASAGGSILAGETVAAGAKRELLEETGIEARELIKVDNRIDTQYHVFYTDYYTKVTTSKEQVKLQPGETIDYQWVSVENFLQLVEQNEILSFNVALLKNKYWHLIKG